MKEKKISKNSFSFSTSEENFGSITDNSFNNEEIYYNNETPKKRKCEIIIMILKELVLFLLIIISAIKYNQSLETSQIEEKDFEPAPSFFMGIIYSVFFCILYDNSLGINRI